MGIFNNVSIACFVLANVITFKAAAQTVPPQPINVYNGTPDSSHTSVRVYNTTNTATHSGVAYYGSQINMITSGSGVASGPASADYAQNLTVQKLNWTTNNTPGEIDALEVVTRNGVGDTAGLSANVSTRQGFSGVLEGVSSILDASNNQVIATRAIVGSTTYNGSAGGYSSNALVAYAEVGTNTSAIDITAKPGAAWTDALEIRQGDSSPILFNINGSGNLMNMGLSQSTADVQLTLGQGRTGSGNSYIDLIGDTTNSTYGLRIIRNAGANGSSAIIHSGVGQLNINGANGGGVALQAASVNRLLVNDTGVGFNGVTPISRPSFPAALPTDGTATNVAIATLLNAVRAALIGYGLAQ